jgi:hypothetical protein
MTVMLVLMITRFHMPAKLHQVDPELNVICDVVSDGEPVPMMTGSSLSSRNRDDHFQARVSKYLFAFMVAINILTNYAYNSHLTPANLDS